MDSYSREQADRLVNRLLSEPGPERARILAQEDHSYWNTLRRQAIRESLRKARLHGRLTDRAYADALAQVEHWHQYGDAANTCDLPVPRERDEPTIELNFHSLQRTECRHDAPRGTPALQIAQSEAAREPVVPHYPYACEVESPLHSDRPGITLPGIDRTAVVHEPLRGNGASLTDAGVRFRSMRAVPRPAHVTADDDEATPTRSSPRASPPPLRSEPAVLPFGSPQRAAAPLIAPKSPSRSSSGAQAPQGGRTSQPITRPTAPARPALSSIPPAVTPPVPAGPFVPGAMIRGRYMLENQIGNGGSSIVFRARDLRRDELDRDAFVALKVPRENLRDREDLIERLKREFHQSQALPHPNIVRVFDIDCEQGTWFLTMELLDGESLSTLLACQQPRRLREREALTIIDGCGRALAFAHENGVLHGDLKPGNVFITRSERVLVLDFGVIGSTLPGRDTSLASRPTTRASAATPCYASPDVLSGQPPDERDDIFSLACVAYEVLTGRHPFDRRSTFDARERGARVRRAPGLSRRRFAALERGLAWSKSRRPKSVMALLAALGIVQRERHGQGWFGAVAAGCIGAIAATVILSLDHVDRIAQKVTWPQSSNSDATRGIARTFTDAAPGALRQVSSESSVPSSERAGERSGGQGSASINDPAGTTPTGNPMQAQTMAPAAPKVAAAAPRKKSVASGAARIARAPAFSGRVSLETASIVANERAVSVVVRVRRLEDSRGRVRIQWRAIPGSAKPGHDYSMDGIGTIDLAEGQDVRVLYIPILDDDVPEENESFDVELFALNGAAQLGPIARSSITIHDDD